MMFWCAIHFRLLLRVCAWNQCVEEGKKAVGSGFSAAGSTGAIRSAGGQMVSMLDGRLQFLVQEPFAGALDHRYELTTGFVGDFGVTIRSGMIHGSFTWMDVKSCANWLERR